MQFPRGWALPLVASLLLWSSHVSKHTANLHSLVQESPVAHLFLRDSGPGSDFGLNLPLQPQSSPASFCTSPLALLTGPFSGHDVMLSRLCSRCSLFRSSRFCLRRSSDPHSEVACSVRQCIWLHVPYRHLRTALPTLPHEAGALLMQCSRRTATGWREHIAYRYTLHTASGPWMPVHSLPKIPACM